MSGTFGLTLCVFVLMRQRLFTLLACFVCLGAAPQLCGGTFELSAAVDRTEVELGEPLHYSITLQVNGRLDFPVQMETPSFPGFQASEPSRSDSSSWINGAVTEVHSFTWELVPIKAGTVVLAPVKANAKDAVNGDVTKYTDAISIQVKKPKNAYMGLSPPPEATPLPTYALQSQLPSQPVADDSGLHDIKADRGLPWTRLGAVAAAFAAVLAFLAWWARRPTAEAPALPVVRDPRSLAFKQLDAALKRLAAGDEKGFTVGAAQALRGYLRQRLDLRSEATLAEAVRACTRRLPDASDRERADELHQRLELLLYGDASFKSDDAGLLDEGSRALINTLERLAGR
jgi:hypothetical protein